MKQPEDSIPAEQPVKQPEEKPGSDAPVRIITAKIPNRPENLEPEPEKKLTREEMLKESEANRFRWIRLRIQEAISESYNKVKKDEGTRRILDYWNNAEVFSNSAEISRLLVRAAKENTPEFVEFRDEFEKWKLAISVKNYTLANEYRAKAHALARQILGDPSISEPRLSSEQMLSMKKTIEAFGFNLDEFMRDVCRKQLHTLRDFEREEERKREYLEKKPMIFSNDGRVDEILEKLFHLPYFEDFPAEYKEFFELYLCWYAASKREEYKTAVHFRDLAYVPLRKLLNDPTLTPPGEENNKAESK